MSTHYIVACWSGLRRTNPPAYRTDRAAFIRRHLDTLQTLKHSLDRITIVVNRNDEAPASFHHYLGSIPNRIGTAAVRIVERPNIGFSYGAYSHVFQLDRGVSPADHYFLMEDDYVFTQDWFDSTMLGVISKNLKTGFLSFVVEGGSREWIMSRAEKESPSGRAAAERVGALCPDRFHYARISVGLARGAALEDVWNKFGKLPYADGKNHTECKFEGQFGLTMALGKAGWEISDMLPEVRAQAYSPVGEILSYGPADKPLFVTPVQGLLHGGAR